MNLEGLRILAAHTEMTAASGFLFSLGVSLAVLGLGGIAVSVSVDKGMRRYPILVTVVTILLAVAAIAVSWQRPRETIVKATMEQGVDAADLLKHYKIIDIDGEIYTLKLISEE